MTGQHEPLWKPEVKLGALEGKSFPAPHTAPVMMPLCRIKEWNALKWKSDTCWILRNRLELELVFVWGIHTYLEHGTSVS